MAYISTKEVSAIRAELKTVFPNVKFSVRKGDGALSVYVSIMQSGLFDDGVYADVNHYWMADNFEGEQLEFLQAVERIIKSAPSKAEGGSEWYNNSDIMTDYFDVAFYYHIQIGQYNKPHKLK